MELLTLVLCLVFLILGIAIGVGAMLAGVYVTRKTGLYFIDNYVKKLTFDDLQRAQGATQGEPMPIDEEVIWASGYSEEEFRRRRKLDEEEDYESLLEEDDNRKY